MDDPSGEVVLVPWLLETQPLVGEQRGEVLKARSVAGLVGFETRHRVDPKQRRVPLIVRRGPAGPFDVVPFAPRETPGLADRHVDVLGRRQIAVAAQEPVALVAQVEQTSDLDQLAVVRTLLARAALKLALSAPL